MGRSCCATQSSGLSILHRSKFMPERGEAISGTLMEEGRTLRTLLDMLPIGVAIAHDSCCEHVEVKSVAANILGVPVDEVISLTGPKSLKLPFKVVRDGQVIPPEKLPVCEAAQTG